MHTNTLPRLALCLTFGAALLVAACNGDDDPAPPASGAGGSLIAGASPGPVQSLANEIGGARGAGGASLDHLPAGGNLLLLTGHATPNLPTALARIGAVSSTADPAVLLGAGRVIDNPYQPDNRGADSPNPLIRVPGLGDTPFPTGKWYKGFFYQTPASLTSNIADAPPWDPAAPKNGKNNASQESVFAFPNRLNLDDRMPMVSAAFPRPRYIAPGLDPNAEVYKLLNRFKSDVVLYPVVNSPLADVQFAASTTLNPALQRSITHQDELTVTTGWANADASQRMDLIAAIGSPYVTVRYTGLAPVIGVGQGITPQFAKDPVTNLPLTRPTTNPDLIGKVDGNGQPFTEAIPDYGKWEATNGLVAVAVSSGALAGVANQPFVEATGLQVKTPDLTGTAFRFIYRVPDPARPAAPRTNNNTPPRENLINRVMNVFASKPITLRWNAASRTYVASATWSGVLRSAFVGEALIADISSDDPTRLNFDATEAVLAQYKDEFPVAGEVMTQYDGGASAQVHFTWVTENLDSSKTPNAANLLMMALDATQTPSLVGRQAAAIAYTSNFGRMSGVVGGQWTQALSVPGILQNLPADQTSKLWYGNGSVKADDKARIVAMLKTEATDTQSFITHCNYESYTCGIYIAKLGRLALIADQLGEAQIRRDLVAFMKQNLNPWFDGSDPSDPNIGVKTDPANPIFNYFIYDRTNKGLVTFRPYNRRDYKDDFYNLIYTDHMFHYGYFIYASAVIARLDEDPAKAWVTKYQPFVDLLVRDIANPSQGDAFFPVLRTFDWFRMQNQANSGPSPNGANTESSSESINSNYALALWADVTGNGTLKALASVMTAAEIRSAQAFYQVTPATSVFRGDDTTPAVVPVSVDISTRAGAAKAVLDVNQVVTRGIVWNQITENNVFFGPRQQFIVGIQVLPVTPISEYVLSKRWAQAHTAELLALEAQTTANYTLAIANVPAAGLECSVDAIKTPPDANPPNTFNYGGACGAAARVENAWRQVLVSLNGVNDPAGTYARFAAILDKSVVEEANFTNVLSNPSINPGSSTDANGSKPDLLRQTSTPSSNTNVLWWLSTLKP